MTPPFHALVLGLRGRDVERILLKHDVPGTVRSLSGPASLAFGLARGRLLQMADLPPISPGYYRAFLWGHWAVVSVGFLGTLASFALGLAANVTLLLALVTIVIAVSAVLSTSLLNKKAKDEFVQAPDEVSPWDLLGWAIVSDPFIGLAVGLFALLFVFLLFVVWLPLLLAIVSLFSFGEAWRSYRVALVTTPESTELASVGRDLLRSGGVLSRGWDVYLASPDRQLASIGRKMHRRVHWAFLAFGASSLTLAISEVASRTWPGDIWSLAFVAFAVASTMSFVLLLGALHRRRTLRFGKIVEFATL